MSESYDESYFGKGARSLRPGVIRRIDQQYAKAAHKLNKRIGDKDITTHAKAEQAVLNIGVLEDVFRILERYYPTHQDVSTKDHIWKNATATGFLVGLLISRSLPERKVPRYQHDGLARYYLSDLYSQAGQSYDLQTALTNRYAQSDLSQKAVELMPRQLAHEYRPGTSTFSRNQRDLYTAALGYTAQVGLTMLVEHEYIAAQVGVSRREARQMAQDVRDLSELGVPDGADQWPTEPND